MIAASLALALAACGPARQPQPVPSGKSPPAAFAQCLGCHAITPGGSGAGPTLAGVYGRRAGTLPGYPFTSELKSSGLVWDRPTLETWLQGPIAMVPGTRMVAMVPDAAQRRAVIDYLETLK